MSICEHHCYMNKKVWARAQSILRAMFLTKTWHSKCVHAKAIKEIVHLEWKTHVIAELTEKQGLVLLKMGAILKTFLTFSGEGGDSSLVVSLEINSVVYQGVLFAQPKSRSRSRERKENRISWMRPTTATTTTHHVHREWRNLTQLGRVKINLFLSLFKLLNFNLKKKY